ncbi:hypothetical protein CDL12_24947 [Handroanthus impetiginosus]|uniref:Small auxin-up RNA n=1 Tax=Handroanthus impetiginosus TaxID=429701 RepID=A0A2G9GB49_9LAMI|nr:hypothetical protein CDL12_24947 [Handroanthus impetiginosus]
MIHNTKHNILRHNYSSSSSAARKLDVPRGSLAVYVGENTDKSRFVIPVSYLNHPLFQELLKCSEEEHGFDHLMGGLTIPCSENVFLNVTSYLNHELHLLPKCSLRKVLGYIGFSLF